MLNYIWISLILLGILVAAGSDIDVQEIDGASYNGIDEVRR